MNEWHSNTSKTPSFNPDNSWHWAQQFFQAFLGLVTQDVLLFIFLLKEDFTYHVQNLENKNAWIISCGPWSLLCGNGDFCGDDIGHTQVCDCTHCMWHELHLSCWLLLAIAESLHRSGLQCNFTLGVKNAWIPSRPVHLMSRWASTYLWIPTSGFPSIKWHNNTVSLPFKESLLKIC